MKYSILLPYYKRPGHLHNTLVSYCHHYSNRHDYEIIIIEDFKHNDEEVIEIRNVIRTFSEDLPISYIVNTDDKIRNPASSFDLGFRMSLGSYIVLSNPECLHVSNILNGLDDEFKKEPNNYIVCACRNVESLIFYIENMDQLKVEEKKWYQHSKHRNRMLHFCSALSRDNWMKVGGFKNYPKEKASKDDVNFKRRVFKNNISIVFRDDLLVYHQNHRYIRKEKK